MRQLQNNKKHTEKGSYKTVCRIRAVRRELQISTHILFKIKTSIVGNCRYKYDIYLRNARR